jgi:cytochrome c-type biogenesis protein CcmH/NrfF
MGIDIKIPIGLMFTILGFLLTVYGFFTRLDPALYQKSLGINVNLWSGLLMLLFGLIMLIFGLISRKSKSS